MSERPGRVVPGVLGAVLLFAVLTAAWPSSAHLMPPRNTVGDYALRASAIAVVRITEPPPSPEPGRPWTGPSPTAAGEVVRVLKAPDGPGPVGWPQKAEWSLVAPTWPTMEKGRLALVFFEQPAGSDRWNSSQTDKDLFELEDPLGEAHPWFDCVRTYLEIASTPPEPSDTHDRIVKEKLMYLLANPVSRVRRDALEEALRFNAFWKNLDDADVARLTGYVEDRSLDGPFRFRLGVVLHLLHDRIPPAKAMAMLAASDEPPLKASLVKLVGACRSPECGRAIIPLIQDDDSNVRMTAVAQAANFPSPESALALVAQLPRESSHYYRKDIVDALLNMAQPEGLSGLEAYFKDVPDSDKLKRHYERRHRRLASEGKFPAGDAGTKAKPAAKDSQRSKPWLVMGGMALLAGLVAMAFLRRPSAP